MTRGRYRLDERGNLELDIEVTGNGSEASSTTFSTTMAAAYRPAVTRHFALGETGVQNTGSSFAQLVVNTSGTVQVAKRGSVGDTVGTAVTLPLD